jgi:hypothetical protein
MTSPASDCGLLRGQCYFLVSESDEDQSNLGLMYDGERQADDRRCLRQKMSPSNLDVSSISTASQVPQTPLFE